MTMILQTCGFISVAAFFRRIYENPASSIPFHRCNEEPEVKKQRAQSGTYSPWVFITAQYNRDCKKTVHFDSTYFRPPAETALLLYR